VPYSSRIPEIVAEINAGIEQVVERTGLRVEAGAKKRARVATGYMRGQIRWTKTGPYSGEVVGGADYTIFNEYGTVYMSAQPMFGPATEEARPLFDAEIKLVIRKAVS
jgi:HK97 gp10 family phage protein